MLSFHFENDCDRMCDEDEEQCERKNLKLTACILCKNRLVVLAFSHITT